MSFETNIKNWVAIDNEIKILNETLKKLRTNRNNICENILGYVDTNNLANATVKISDGKLRFASARQSPPLTLKYVEYCLQHCLQSEEKVNTVMQYIKESRTIKDIPEIRRTYTN